MCVVNMQIHKVALISDKTHRTELYDYLSARYSVQRYTTDQLDRVNAAQLLFVVLDTNFDQPQATHKIRLFFEKIKPLNVESIFVFDAETRRAKIQYFALGGSAYTVRPLTPGKLAPLFTKFANLAVERSWENLPKPQAQALKTSLQAFNTMNILASDGQPIDMNDIKACGQQIAEVTKCFGLHSLIEPLKHHHNSSYVHVLRTCCYSVSFAHHIGIKADDLTTIAMAGLVHDIGKADIPPAILDKPGALTKTEVQRVQKHTATGRTILSRSATNIDPNIAEVVYQHHERLDGSGYPQGLKGMQIADITVLVSIADVFAALTEERTYSKTLSYAEAYNVLLEMTGKLDSGIVKALKPLVMQELSPASKAA
jgi:HD-GYP domain-containing protein (c-di-GMP phosphodiesterase class II)